MHGVKKLAEDNYHAYYESEHGVKVVPHSGEWIGYYRLDKQAKLILTAFCEGKAPAKLTIPIRTWEDLKPKCKMCDGTGIHADDPTGQATCGYCGGR